MKRVRKGKWDAPGWKNTTVGGKGTGQKLEKPPQKKQEPPKRQPQRKTGERVVPISDPFAPGIPYVRDSEGKIIAWWRKKKTTRRKTGKCVRKTARKTTKRRK